MAIQPIIAFYPTAEIVDVLGEWQMFSQFGDCPAETFLDLTLELVETHVINSVFETNSVRHNVEIDSPSMFSVRPIAIVSLH